MLDVERDAKSIREARLLDREILLHQLELFLERDFVRAMPAQRATQQIAQLLDHPPDVIFLDVQMPGIGGFEVIRRRTPERMPAVVFLTAYDQFALRAFDAQALDYLVKPVAEARFAATMRRLARQLGAGPTAPREQAIVITTSRGVTVVPLHDIDWIEAADNYARIWTGNRSHLLRESLRALERRVEPGGFLRAHRRALVRIGAVRDIVRTRDDELIAVLASGVRVPVSRRRRAAFTRAVRDSPPDYGV